MIRLLVFLNALIALALHSPFAQAKLVKKDITYKQGDSTLEGYLVYDDQFQGRRPGIVVVPDWLGVTENSKKNADKVAALGYVALAADIYGKGVRPKNQQEASQQATKYRENRKLLRERAQAALSALVAQKNVDKTKLGAIGFCFGGGAALELARSGADLDGVVSFHGNLDTPNPADAKNIKGRVLVLHGADDPYVPGDQVMAFENEMRNARVDWELIKYGNAVHSFTDETAGTDSSQGRAYNPEAAERAWKEMKDLFADVF